MTGMDAYDDLRAARRSYWKNRLVWFGIACAVLAAAVLIRLTQGDVPAAAASPQAARPAATVAEDGKELPRPGRPQHDVMALVNGKDISRRDLVAACVERYGEDVLESLVNKRLITSHCANRGIAVTNEEINAEIDRMAKRFQLGREQWLELLEKERGVSPQEYARDIVWPTLALRKLADKDLQVSKQEIDQAYEQEYGAMVRARLIVVSDEAKARDLQARLAANPDDFARAAIENSEDVNSASVGGIIQPIRRHVGDQAVEAAAFALQPGQVSAVVPVGRQFAILKCDERVPPRQVPLATVQETLVDRIKEDKLREAASGIFAQVQKTATIQNVYNAPELRQTMPGVVATVNGDRITMQELGNECLLRHGSEVLEGEISRLLLEQELAAAKISVTQADVDAEIVHGAELAGCLDQQGNADVARWLETVTAEQAITKDQYIRDSVWPSAALKKLTAAEVEVTEEDVVKGFEANFGERVECRAIVLANMRRAQEVWDKARRNPAPEYFGDLAAEYSVEPTSKALRGEVPPIGKHGGQEQLEKVAFQLQEGQISGIVQLGDKFVILRCEGRTQPQDMSLNDPKIREILHRDIFEKKLRMAMGRKFEEINERARVDNYLAGTSQSPEKPKASPQPVREDTAVRPTAGTAR
ncbi:MAG: peptidylprolyl isomerase [Pirellulales bacterium]|nr:peptidylprolyl isomerase [Pirellulales bacterium]